MLARVELVVEHAIAEHAEAAEGVAGKKRAGRRLEGEHGLRPMHVGRLHEGKDQARPEVEAIARLDRLYALLDLIEALHELDALGRREYLDLGIDALVIGEPSRMVGLEVVEHEIIYVGQPQASLGKAGFEGRRGSAPIAHEIDEGDLLALDQVGVEGNAVGYGPDPLEEVFGLHVRMQRVDSIAYLLGLHGSTPCPLDTSLRPAFALSSR